MIKYSVEINIGRNLWLTLAKFDTLKLAQEEAVKHNNQNSWRIKKITFDIIDSYEKYITALEDLAR